LGIACLLHESPEERSDATGIAFRNRNVQQVLSWASSKGINTQQPSTPARIAINLSVVRNRALDCRNVRSWGYAEGPIGKPR
jgi:hypothetical protein